MSDHDDQQCPPRREFLLELGALGVCGAAGVSLLSSRTGAGGPLDLGGKAASVEKFATFFTCVKELDKSSPKIAGHLGGFTGAEQIAAVALHGVAKSNPENKNVGLNLARMVHFSILGMAMNGASKADMKVGEIPSAQQVQGFADDEDMFDGVGCDDSGLWCGISCPEATGSICGITCPKAGGLDVDSDAVLFNKDILQGCTLVDADRALLNATAAYDQIF